MSVNNDSKIPAVVLGRPWNTYSTHNTFEEANSARTEFLEKNNKMQAKIRRRRSKNTFLLKTRLLSEFVKQENKKRGKGKRRNKKNSNGRKLDSSSVI